MIPDPIMLNDNDSLDADSETDYSDLDVDLRAKCNSDSSHVADGQPADSDTYGSETTHPRGRLAAAHPEEVNDNNSSVADRPGSASPGHRCVTH